VLGSSAELGKDAVAVAAVLARAAQRLGAVQSPV
jgi:hypothetical protein